MFIKDTPDIGFRSFQGTECNFFGTKASVTKISIGHVYIVNNPRERKKTLKIKAVLGCDQ